MNTIKIVFLILIGMLVGSPLSAKDEEQVTIEETDNIAYLKQEHSKLRPQLPSKVFLQCHYSKGRIKFVFSPESDIHRMEITIGRDESVVWFGHVTRLNPETSIPILYGEYDITCRTDGNQIFKGKLNFNN